MGKPNEDDEEDEDDDVCEVIEDGALTDEPVYSGENLVSSSSSSEPDKILTEFEATKLKLKELTSKPESAVKTRTPSRNLTAFLAQPALHSSNQKGAASRVEDQDNMEMETTPTPTKSNESSK